MQILPVKADRLIRPGRRKQRASAKPSRAQAAFPLSDYIIPPGDSHGRSATLSLSVPPTMHRLMSIIREQKSMPFETLADVARWCLYQGLRQLDKLAHDEEITGKYKELQLLIQTAALEGENQFYQKHLSAIIGRVEKLAEAGHDEKALNLADLTWRQTDMIEDPYWRVFYRTTAKKALDELRKSVARRKREMERRAARNGDDQ